VLVVPAALALAAGGGWTAAVSIGEGGVGVDAGDVGGGALSSYDPSPPYWPS
jgi:hypothetical protein